MMYDYERLGIDVQRMRQRDPHGVVSTNDFEWRAKRDQLEEMADKIEDPAAAFIIAEMLRNV